MKTKYCGLIIVSLLTSGLFSSLFPAVAAEPPRIPRRSLLVDADKTSVQLSPDGQAVGWIAPDPTGRKLIVRQLNGASSDQPLPLDGSLVAWQWATQPGWVLAVTRTGAGETLTAVPLPTLAQKPRSLCQGSRVRVVGSGKDGVMASVRTNDESSSGLFRIPFDGIGREKVAELEDFDGWWFDSAMRLVAGRRLTANGFTLERRSEDGAWIAFAEVGPLDMIPCGIVSVSANGSRISYVAREGHDTTALFELDTSTGHKRVLAHDPKSDSLAIGATLDTRTGQPSSVVSYRVRLQRHILDPSLQPDFDALSKTRRGDVSIAGQSADNTRWLVRWLDGGPARYAVWDRQNRRIIELFDDVPGLDQALLAARQPLIFPSRDGLELHCDLYLPPGSDADSDGRPDRPLPTVLFVHGGPWIGFEWNLWPVNHHFQLLANRGYAVIRAGFRGEVGYGSKYVDAGDRQWSGAMHRDLVDTVDHAVHQGIAARDRVAIWGWSYGGYATALALALAPDRFACGLAMYGVYDLPKFLDTPFGSNPFWRQRVGDVRTAQGRERAWRDSPLAMADRIRQPLLVTHGAGDQRVPMAQSDALVNTLTDRAHPVVYLTFSDEGHDYARLETWETFWAVGEALLKEHLQGVAEPFPKDWPRPGVEIRAGGPQITVWQSGKRDADSG